jgi:carboxyl-terminal processing protease
MPRLKIAARFALLGAVAMAGGVLGSQLAVASTQRESPYHLLDQLARVLVLLENDYVEPIDRERLIEGAIKGMVNELDPHSAYLPPGDYAILQGDTEGRFGGIGVEVDFRDDVITVIAPIEGGPAARAGVRSGDQIIAIDGQLVRGRKAAELVRAMRGQPGSSVRITLRREGSERPLVLTLEREVINVASISSKLLDHGIGYVRIKAFQSGTQRELVDTVAKLRKERRADLEGVVLDLRSNPGGLVNEARAVADEFLDHGIIFSTRHRGKIIEEARASARGSLERVPVVVLTNEYTASAAEIVAGALQDARRAPIVGSTTYGKGSVQSVIDLPGGAGLRLTTMRYYTPSGTAIQAQGITPDVRIAATYVPSAGNVTVERERDLANHLPPEGPPGSAPTDDAGAPHSPDATHLGVTREVPKDPTNGPDVALSIGYQMVRGVLKKPAGGIPPGLMTP